MAIPFDITAIEEKLSAFNTAQQKEAYINKLIFSREKALVEFEMYDKEELERLKEKTIQEYEAYKNEFDKGNLVYIQGNDSSLLAKRLRLEQVYNNITGQLAVLKALKSREISKGQDFSTININPKLIWNGTMEKLCSVSQQLIQLGWIGNQPGELTCFMHQYIMGAEIKGESITEPAVKLDWRGKKNQIYYVLKQLKESGLLGNTYDTLIDFLHSAVSIFENDNKGTTSAALKKTNTLPKSRRINLNI